MSPKAKHPEFCLQFKQPAIPGRSRIPVAVPAHLTSMRTATAQRYHDGGHPTINNDYLIDSALIMRLRRDARSVYNYHDEVGQPSFSQSHSFFLLLLSLQPAYGG